MLSSLCQCNSTTQLDAIQFQVHLLNRVVCCVSILHYRVERGVWVWPSVHTVCVATSSSYDDIFVVIQVLVLSELDLFDHGGTFVCLLIIPVGYWPFFPARGEVEGDWPIEE